MGYFIRPTVYEETKEQYKTNQGKYGLRWIIDMMNEMFIGLRTNKIDISELHFGTLGYMISTTPYEILSKYFNIYEMKGGDDMDIIYEFKLEKEEMGNSEPNGEWYKTSQSYLDTMWDDLLKSPEIDDDFFTSEERKLEVKEQLRTMMDSGFRKWEYH